MKLLAPGLSLKVAIMFCKDKIKGEKEFSDKMQIIGDTFKADIPIKAYTPQEMFFIPEFVNLGKLISGKENLCKIMVKN